MIAKKLVLGAAGVGTALVMLAGPAGAQAYPPPIPPVVTVDVSDSRVAEGDLFSVTASGLGPISSAEIYVTRGRQHGLTDLAGSVNVDSSGVARFDLVVPEGIQPGLYFITVEGVDGEGNPVVLHGVFAVLPAPAASAPANGRTGSANVSPLGLTPAPTPPSTAGLQVPAAEEEALLSDLVVDEGSTVVLDGSDLVVARGPAASPARDAASEDDSGDLVLQVAGTGMAAVGIVVVTARKRRHSNV